MPDVRASTRGNIDINVNGGRTTNNAVALEGINVNDLNLAHFDNVPLPNPHAVQEFKTATSLYDASQGSKGGGALDLNVSYIPGVSPMLRIVGDEVQTSLGAHFPVSHALRALTFVRRVRELGQEYVHNGHTVHLGHYAIDRIEADGTVHAGCHVVKWDEIERITPQLVCSVQLQA